MTEQKAKAEEIKHYCYSALIEAAKEKTSCETSLKDLAVELCDAMDIVSERISLQQDQQ